MRSRLQFLLVGLVVLAFVAGCATSPEAIPVVEDNAPAAEEVTALLVGKVPYTISQLEGMETIEVENTGKDGEVTVYSGVLVMDLLTEAGLTGDMVVFIASDGYEAELALSELEGCVDCVVAFDDEELRMVLPCLPSNLQVKGVVEVSVK